MTQGNSTVALQNGFAGYVLDVRGGSAGLSDYATPSNVTTNFHHPLYNIAQSAFINADHLKPGDEL